MGKILHRDDFLWKCFIQGDDEAFASIYELYIDILYAYGKRYTSDEDLLLDCVQETFVDIHKYRASLAPEVNIKFYLFSSLKRKLIRSIKKVHAEEDHMQSYDYQNSGTFSLNFNAEDILIHNEEHAECLKRLTDEMNMLPAKQKEILYLRFNSSLDYEQIAVLMNISVSSCRTQVYRAVKQLRKNLESTAHKLLLHY